MREPSHVYTAKGIIQSRHNAIWRGLGLAVGCRFWPDAVNPGTWAEKQQVQLMWEDSGHLLKRHLHWMEIHSDRNKSFYFVTCEEVWWLPQRGTHPADGARAPVTFSDTRQARRRKPEQQGRKDDLLKTVKLKSLRGFLKKTSHQLLMDCWVRVNLGTNRHGIHPRHSEYT